MGRDVVQKVDMSDKFLLPASPECLIRRKDPFGRDYFWIGGSPPSGAGEPGTDVHAIAAGFVSVTPVQLDLTNHDLIQQIASWDLRA